MHRIPGMADVRRSETGELEWRDLPASAVGLGVSGRPSGGACEGGEAVVVVERAVLLAVDDDVLQWRRGRGPNRTCPGARERGSAGQDGRGDTGRGSRARRLQEGSPTEIRRHRTIILTRSAVINHHAYLPQDPVAGNR